MILQIYPNPSKNSITVSSEMEDNSVIDIFDVLGRKIDTWSLLRASGSHAIIDIERLTSGVYFIRITNNSRKVYNGMFIKQ